MKLFQFLYDNIQYVNRTVRSHIVGRPADAPSPGRHSSPVPSARTGALSGSQRRAEHQADLVHVTPLPGQIVAVFGGSSGINLATAQTASTLGASVTIS